MHPLDGPRLKVKRAINEINLLRIAENTFRKDTHYSVIKAEFNHKTGRDVYRYKLAGNPPSLEWGIDIGEIIHNLRSALDELVWQLALLNTKKPSRKTEFPIYLVGKTTRKQLNQQGKLVPIRSFTKDGKPKITCLSKKHQKMIEKLQPYKRGNHPRFVRSSRLERGKHSSPLYWLQEINNADKHRLVQVIGAKSGVGPQIMSQKWDMADYRFFGNTILKDGAKWAELPVNDLHVHPDFSPIIAFSEGCPIVKNIGVLFVLNKIATKVSDIIESFASEF